MTHLCRYCDSALHDKELEPIVHDGKLYYRVRHSGCPVYVMNDKGDLVNARVFLGDA